jgi:hypothetical protein
VLRYYELDPAGRYVWSRGHVTGRRKITRGLLGRPRGWGKSPLLAALTLVEALGPVVPDGWDADGQPVGVPWSRIARRCAGGRGVGGADLEHVDAAAGDVEGPVVDNYPGLEPLGTFVNLPVGGASRPARRRHGRSRAPGRSSVCSTRPRSGSRPTAASSSQGRCARTPRRSAGRRSSRRTRSSRATSRSRGLGRLRAVDHRGSGAEQRPAVRPPRGSSGDGDVRARVGHARPAREPTAIRRVTPTAA